MPYFILAHTVHPHPSWCLLHHQSSKKLDNQLQDLLLYPEMAKSMKFWVTTAFLWRFPQENKYCVSEEKKNVFLALKEREERYSLDKNWFWISVALIHETDSLVITVLNWIAKTSADLKKHHNPGFQRHHVMKNQSNDLLPSSQQL